MAKVLKGIVSVLVVAACAGDHSRKVRLPETSFETESDPRKVNFDLEVRDTRQVSKCDTMANDGRSTRLLEEPHEETSIQPIDRPFVYTTGPSGLWKQNTGISLLSLGEPKSATTWMGRMIPALAIEICGSRNNPWCQLGGLVVHDNVPAPCYEFELLLNKTTDGIDHTELFLHFYGRHKHKIPGINQHLPPECRNGGRIHGDTFMDLPPCESDEPPTRELLTSCLWDTSPRCTQLMSMVRPSVRSLVIMRDPRSVVLSEYKMRAKLGRKPAGIGNRSLDEFIKWKFEVLVSWMHQRFIWHTGPLMERSSHIVIYEDLQESHVGFIDIAAFMGLECSETQAAKVWEAHRQRSRDGGYNTYGLPVDTIRWMNITMATLLPPVLACRWEVQPMNVR
ncbi:unnamed protein product [Ectocarpus sp. 8 AP-2014]